MWIKSNYLQFVSYEKFKNNWVFTNCFPSFSLKKNDQFALIASLLLPEIKIKYKISKKERENYKNIYVNKKISSEQ